MKRISLTLVGLCPADEPGSTDGVEKEERRRGSVGEAGENTTRRREAFNADGAVCGLVKGSMQIQ